MLTLKQKREDFWGLSNDNVAIQGIIFTQSTLFPTQQSQHLMTKQSLSQIQHLTEDHFMPFFRHR